MFPKVFTKLKRNKQKMSEINCGRADIKARLKNKRVKPLHMKLGQTEVLLQFVSGVQNSLPK